MTSHLKYKNVNISKTKKGIPKRKTPFFFTLKSLSNQQQFKTQTRIKGLFEATTILHDEIHA